MTAPRHLRPVVAALALLGVLAVAAPAGAQDDAPTSTTAQVRDGDAPLNDILPQPNSGQAPESPGDPGGWQQLLVLGALVAGLAGIVLLVRREAKKATAARHG